VLVHIVKWRAFVGQELKASLTGIQRPIAQIWWTLRQRLLKDSTRKAGQRSELIRLDLSDWLERTQSKYHSSLEPSYIYMYPGSVVNNPGMSAGLTTLYDAAFAGLVLAGRRSQPRTKFHRDIAPIFERMTDMQWVNAGYLTTNGFGSLRDWTTAAWQKRLTDRSAANAPLRQAILGTFRDPYYGSVQPSFEPQEYGDRVQLPSNRDEPRQWLAITPVQYAHLRAWAEGRFTIEQTKRPTSLADLPYVEQPAALDCPERGTAHQGRGSGVDRIPAVVAGVGVIHGQ